MLGANGRELDLNARQIDLSDRNLGSNPPKNEPKIGLNPPNGRQVFAYS
jgi:hypothetical protein